MNTCLRTLYIIVLSYVHTNSQKTREYIRIFFYGHHFGRHLGFKATEYTYVLYHGLFILPDTEIDKKWIAQNCVQAFIPHRDRHQHIIPLSSMLIYQYLCLSRSLDLSCMVSGSVNTPLISNKLAILVLYLTVKQEVTQCSRLPKNNGKGEVTSPYSHSSSHKWQWLKPSTVILKSTFLYHSLQSLATLLYFVIHPVEIVRTPCFSLTQL